MGEYANYRSQRVRASQRFDVDPLGGNVNPGGDDAYSIRFRFPWPDEDGVTPGSFDPYDRDVVVPGLPASTQVEHYAVQFVSTSHTARGGYLLSLPCPESGGTLIANGEAVRIGRNGVAGAILLSQEKVLRDGRLVPVLRCGGCESAWRVEDPHEIEAIVVACRAEGDRPRGGVNDPVQTRTWWHTIADRIAIGAKLHEQGLVPRGVRG